MYYGHDPHPETALAGAGNCEIPCIAFIDHTKALDLMSRSGFFQMVEPIGCPPECLIHILPSFHTDIKIFVQYDGFTSD